MAQGQIKKSDLVQDNVLAEFNKELKQTIANVNALKTAITATAQAGKQIKSGMGAKPKDVASMKEFNKLNERALQNSKNRLSLNKGLKHQKAKLTQLQRDENKAIKTTVESQAKLTQKQKQELGTLQKLELSNRKLRAERAKLNLETKKGSQRLTQINKKLDQNNAKIRASGDAMKKQRLNVGNYKSALGGLRNSLAQLGLAFGVFALVKGSFNVVKDFEQSQADLASVLGVSTKGMAALTEQAKELGATTTFTASQVGELQKELAKLGFTQQQIQAMTEATLLLAEATGTDLARAAEVTGATIRGFGLAAEDTQRVVDVMAKSFSSSSLDMEKFATGMATVAPIAKQMGFSLEETTALLGVLTDRGIDASTAGTGLRNMFLNASKEGMTLNEALEQVNNASDKTGESFDLFGKRGATLGVILAENQEAVGDLTRKLYASDKAAQQMADTQRNTLGGSIKLLTSAWEGWILKQNESSGASNKLRSVIEYLSKNIERILGWVMMAVKQFLFFKAAMIASKLAMMAYNAVVLVTSKSMKGFLVSMRKMDKGMKSTGIGLLVSLLIQLVYWIYQAVTAETQLEKAERERKETLAELKREEQEQLDQLTEGISSFRAMITMLKKTNKGSKERASLIEKINKKYSLTLKNLKDEAKFQNQVNLQVDAYIKLQKTRFLQARNQKALTKELTLQVEAEEEILKIKTELTKSQKEGETFRQLRKRFGASNVELLAWEEQLRLSTDAIDKLGAAGVDLETDIFDPLDDLGDPDPDPGTPEKAISLIKQTEDAQLAIIKNASKREIEIRQKTFDRLVKSTKKKKTNKEEFDAWLIAQENLLSHDLLAIKNKFVDKEQKARDKTAERIRKENEKIKSEEQKKISKQLDLLQKFDDQRKIDVAKIAILNAELAGDEEAIIKAKIELIKVELEIKTALMREGTVERIKAEKEAQLKIKNLLNNGIEDEAKQRAEAFEITRAAIDASTQYFLDQADKRIEKIDEEISAAEKQADIYRELAMNGNITAKESLAEQNRLIAEANREKAEEERKKQLIEKGSAILLAFNAALEGGDKPGEAFLKAITTVAGLDLFINALSFMGGTEDTGHTGSGVDGKGGFHAILHPKEGVLKREHNERKLQAGFTNETMLNSALKYQNLLDQRTIGSHIDVNTQIGNGWDSHLIVDNLLKVGDKLDTVTKAINDKPVYKAELGKSMSKMMEIKETIERGNRKTTNTFVVKQ